jgi:cardiolipin synthase
MISNNIVTIPNLLTFGWALLVFFFAGISDGIDGFVARKFNQQSSLGTILDPIADKLLMTTAFIILALPHILPADNKHFPVPFWVSAAVIGRDILIVTVALGIFIMTSFRGFQPSWLGKASTTVQILGVGIVLIASVFPIFSGYYLPTVYFLIALFAFLSGVHYIFHVAKLMRAEGKTL